MNGRIALGLLVVLVLILVAVGVGAYAYNLGLAQGMSDTGKLTTPYPYPYGGPFFFRPFGFGFFGILGPLFFILLIFLLVRALFWGRRWGYYRRDWEHGVPPPFEEWHRKMHETK